MSNLERKRMKPHTPHTPSVKGQKNSVKSFFLTPNKILDKMAVTLRRITKPFVFASIPLAELICRLQICSGPKRESFISFLSSPTLGLDLSQNQENFPLGKGG